MSLAACISASESATQFCTVCFSASVEPWRSATRPLTQHVEGRRDWPSQRMHGGCGRAEAGLGQLESGSLVADEVGGGNPDVGVTDLGMVAELPEVGAGSSMEARHARCRPGSVDGTMNIDEPW